MVKVKPGKAVKVKSLQVSGHRNFVPDGVREIRDESLEQRFSTAFTGVA